MHIAGSQRVALALCASVVLGTASCFFGGDGGTANDNGYTPTRPADPARVILTPQPGWLLSVYEGHLYAVNTDSLAVTLVPEVRCPCIIGFTHSGERALVYTPHISEVRVLDLAGQFLPPAQVFPVEGEYDRMDVSADDSMVVFIRNKKEAVFYDLHTGELVNEVGLRFRVIDVDFTPDGQTMVATTDHGNTVTRLQFVDLRTFTMETVLVSNCTGQLMLAGEGRRAFVGPPTGHLCAFNSISVLDLQSRQVVASLPGAEPVALTSDGRYVIGFTQIHWNETPPGWESGDYLIFIRPDTLQWEWYHLGHYGCIYRIARNGNRVMVYDELAIYWLDLHVVDIETGEAKVIEIPPITATDSAVTTDGRAGYLLSHDRRLFGLDLEAGAVKELQFHFEPTTVQLLPDDSRLILTGPLGRDLYFLDTRTDRLTAQVQLPLP